VSANSPDTALYISYNGINAALVQSQVINYLRTLHTHGWNFLLITFEREPLDSEQIDQRSAQLQALGIDWYPHFYRPGGAAIISGILRASRLAMTLVRRNQVSLIHCRSFIPAIVGAATGAVSGRPWIFDIRGFWVDEKTYKGRISPTSAAYRLGKWVERQLYRRCAAVVALTQASANIISALPLWQQQQRPPVVVIPTCVDIAAFQLPHQASARVRFGYLGSLGPGYMAQQILEFFEVVVQAPLAASLTLISQTDNADIPGFEQRRALHPEQLALASAAPHEVPQRLTEIDIGLSFIEPHYCKQASCPTKLGEYLAAGIPVIANDIGDMASVLRRDRVGVIIEDFSPAGYLHAAQEAMALRAEPDFQARCQRAVARFSLTQGSAQYLNLYQQVLAAADKELA
jgi:glycosyltransferase involved in cell wall biosynthesis